jgi:hypothetical protein
MLLEGYVTICCWKVMLRYAAGRLCCDMLLEGYVAISLASLSTASLLMFGLKTNITLNCI